MTKEILTSNEKLRQLVKDGHFFAFCVAFALRKGFRDQMKQSKDFTFLVGDYEVVFKPKERCFVFSHKIYFARIITAYYQEVYFVGDDEQEVISELLTELEKELN